METGGGVPTGVEGFLLGEDGFLLGEKGFLLEWLRGPILASLTGSGTSPVSVRWQAHLRDPQTQP